MNKAKAPFVRTESTSGKMMLDVLLALIPLGVLSYVNYGRRPLYIILLTMATALFCEILCDIVRRRPVRTYRDGTAAVTGMLIGLAMSPIVDYWVPMLGAAFAILVVKAPFGGTGRNVFNPAAAGIAVLAFCFPGRMFTYPAVLGTVHLPTTMSVTDVVTEQSLATQLLAGATPTYTGLDLFLGDFAGPIGATAALILLAFIGYLLVHRTISGWVVLPYLATCLLMAFLSPMGGMSREYSTLAQLCSGYVLFAGAFLINDPVTAPRFWLGRLFYGVFAGLLVMAMQHIGENEASACFAVLIMNAVSPIIDRWSWHGWHWLTNLSRIRREVKSYE